MLGCAPSWPHLRAIYHELMDETQGHVKVPPTQFEKMMEENNNRLFDPQPTRRTLSCERVLDVPVGIHINCVQAPMDVNYARSGSDSETESEVSQSDTHHSHQPAQSALAAEDARKRKGEHAYASRAALYYNVAR